MGFSTADVLLGHLPEAELVRLLCHRVTFSPLPILCSLEGSHNTQNTPKE